MHRPLFAPINLGHVEPGAWKEGEQIASALLIGQRVDTRSHRDPFLQPYVAAFEKRVAKHANDFGKRGLRKAPAKALR